MKLNSKSSPTDDEERQLSRERVQPELTDAQMEFARIVARLLAEQWRREQREPKKSL